MMMAMASTRFLPRGHRGLRALNSHPSLAAPRSATSLVRLAPCEAHWTRALLPSGPHQAARVRSLREQKLRLLHRQARRMGEVQRRRLTVSWWVLPRRLLRLLQLQSGSLRRASRPTVGGAPHSSQRRVAARHGITTRAASGGDLEHGVRRSCPKRMATWEPLNRLHRRGARVARQDGRARSRARCQSNPGVLPINPWRALPINPWSAANQTLECCQSNPGVLPINPWSAANQPLESTANRTLEYCQSNPGEHCQSNPGEHCQSTPGVMPIKPWSAANQPLECCQSSPGVLPINPWSAADQTLEHCQSNP